MVLYIIIGVLFVIFLFFYLVTYFQGKKASIKLNADDFKQHMRKGQLIDVRTKNEFKTGHINGARNISMQTITREYGKLRKDQPIYIYCASGKRSRRAAIYLYSKGFNNLYELENGLKSWSGPLK